jgi:hypothetical protein
MLNEYSVVRRRSTSGTQVAGPFQPRTRVTSSRGVWSSSHKQDVKRRSLLSSATRRTSPTLSFSVPRSKADTADRILTRCTRLETLADVSSYRPATLLGLSQLRHRRDLARVRNLHLSDPPELSAAPRLQRLFWRVHSMVRDCGRHRSRIIRHIVRLVHAWLRHIRH